MYSRVSPQGPGINAEDKRGQPSAAWITSHERHGSSQSQNGDFAMDIELPTYLANGQTTNVQGSPMAQEFPARPVVEPEPMQDHVNGQAVIPPPGNKLGKLGALSFGKKHGKWGLGMFGGDKSHHHGLPPLEEVPVPANPMPSLKRMQSSSTDSRSLRDLSPARESPLRTDGDVKKINKKEAERVQREAEKQRRKLAEKMHREQARAVMQKRNQMMQKTMGNDIEWEGGNEQRLVFSETLPKGKQASSGPIRQNQINNGNSLGPTTISAAAGRFALQGDSPAGDRDWRGANERVLKARRREFDDDHSMSSSDVHSIGRVSSISFATVDSDPGPSRIRNRPSLFGIGRMTSMSSLRTSFDDFSPSARSSNSFSLEGQLAHDFHMQASVNTTHLAGSVSPPPMQMLSLSPSLSPPLSPSPPWIQVQHVKEPLSAQSPTFVNVPLVHSDGSYGQFEVNKQLHAHSPNSYGHPPSPGNTPTSAKSAINPIFKVVSYNWDTEHSLVPDDFGDSVQPPLPPHTGDSQVSPNALPPFSQLEAIAGGELPPLSPMSFVSTPSEDA
jgi:meiosis induction protein kinase IME2/SME1